MSNNITKRCKKKTDKKYVTRNSPAYSASDCKTLKKKGNDGSFYISKPDKNGIYKWVSAAQTMKTTTKAKTKHKPKSNSKTKKVVDQSALTMEDLQDIVKRACMSKNGTKKKLATSIYRLYEHGKQFGTKYVNLTKMEQKKLEKYLFDM